MSDFVFYSIDFTNQAQMDFNDSSQTQKTVQEAVVIQFASIFEDNSLNLCAKIKGENKIFENNIWKYPEKVATDGAITPDGTIDFVYRTYNKVFLWRINKETKVPYVKEDENNTNDIPEFIGDHVQSLPFFYCIIDIRNIDHPIIAIQKSSVWYYNIDKTKEFMEQQLSRFMNEKCGYHITLSEITRDIDFFEYIRERIYKKDSLLNLSLMVYNPNSNSGIQIDKSIPIYIKTLIEMLEENQLTSSSLDLDVSNTLNVDELKKKKVVEEMMGVCMEKKNNILMVANLKSRIKIVYGEKIRISVKLNSDYIDEYKEGKTAKDTFFYSNEFNLIKWLDNTINDNKLFQDEEKIHQPRNNRRKK